MLKQQLIHPKINEVLARAGHHALILIADGHYPCSSKRGPNAELVSLNLMPGIVSCTEVLRAVLSAVPVDAIQTMGYETEGKYALTEDPRVWDEYRQVVLESGLTLPLEPIFKWDFYQAVATPRPRPDDSDRRPAAVCQPSALDRRPAGRPSMSVSPSPLPVTIDAHHHLWQRGGTLNYAWLDTPGLEPIRRDFGPVDLFPLLQAEGIDGSIYVQTLASLDETRWALKQARLHPFIVGVVGWVDLASASCPAQLEEFQADPHFVGVRHVVHDEPDVDFIVQPSIMRGLQTLSQQSVPYDLLLRPEHLHHVARLARDLPDLRMVIDHLAKPEIKAGRLEGWIENFRAASLFPNVFCKLSGMITEADHQSWHAKQLQPYVTQALDLFGPDRLMFGSDWPVCELAGSYHQVHRTARDCLVGLSQAETAAIFGGTAANFYAVNTTTSLNSSLDSREHLGG